MSPASEKTYAVKGMTCSHCQASVTEEVEKVQGVTGIEVDLKTGLIAVSGQNVSDDAVRGAVGEAGYQVVSA